MSTIRQFISDIRSMNKLLNSDNIINDRTIWGEMKSAALVLIKQQTDRRKLFQSPNLFTPLPCLEMEKVPIGECCEFTSDRIVAKSKEAIPKIAEGLFGLLVQNVNGLDTLTHFKEATAKRYANLLKLGVKTDHYFWLYNNHLYVSNSDTKSVNLTAYFEEEIPSKLACPECNCKPSPDCDPCQNPLDAPFKCPGFLENAVKDMVNKRLLTNYFNAPIDKQSDNKDETSK